MSGFFSFHMIESFINNPPPRTAVLFTIMQCEKKGPAFITSQQMPPPSPPAELFLRVELIMDGLPDVIRIPLPFPKAVLFSMVQFLTTIPSARNKYIPA